MKRIYDPYAPALVAAASKRIEAQERLAKAAQESMASDPAVAAARRDLAAVDARLRAAYTEATKGPGGTR
jgi:hypothetical protein